MFNPCLFTERDAMRNYGLLLHISSLPSASGIGDLGPAAHAFARSMAEIGARIWQFLPLNTTSTYIGNSPYSSPSAFAGNPLFISPELLMRDGYLSYTDLDASLGVIPQAGLSREPDRVDFAAVSEHRHRLLQSVFDGYHPRLEQNQDYADFCRKHMRWLHDYARFVSLKERFGGQAWFCWPEPYAQRDPDALEEWDAKERQTIEREKFTQFLFFNQWAELRSECRKVGVSLLGDVPIYVTHDSADVWANPQYFSLDDNSHPITVSGVPPDYFCPLGQRWGNPVYRWDIMEQDGFAWWKQRLSHTLEMVDIARLDHFRGFCSHWDIPAGEETAVNGSWKPVPGRALFSSLKERFGYLPLMAEDLGVITPDVRELMREFELPGMHVLHFAYGGDYFAENNDIPHNHSRNSFVYTGTHDNTTTKDWFLNAGQRERDNLAAYSGRDLTTDNICEIMIRQAFSSVAECAIVPVQDILNLGAEGRMNSPGVADGNWTWRLMPEQMRAAELGWMWNLARSYGRLIR